MKEYIFRAVMIGGALGIMATYMLGMEPPRAFFLGVVAGAAAGVTHYFLDKKKK